MFGNVDVVHEMTNDRRAMIRGQSDRKANSLEKCSTSGNVVLSCALKQTQSNKRHVIDIRL